jgi:hypothetical protein
MSSPTHIVALNLVTFVEPPSSHFLVDLIKSMQDHLTELQTEEMGAEARKVQVLESVWRRLVIPRLFDPGFDPNLDEDGSAAIEPLEFSPSSGQVNMGRGRQYEVVAQFAQAHEGSDVANLVRVHGARGTCR